MFPCFSQDYSADGALRDSKYYRQVISGQNTIGVFESYFLDSGRIKLGHRVCAAFKSWVAEGCLSSSFFVHVSNIVRKSPEKKVCWPDAQPVIAFMQNTHSFRDLSEVNHPGESTDSNLLRHSTGPEVASFVRAFSSLGSGPVPALFRLLYFTPKTLFCGHSRRLLTHYFRSVKRNTDLRERVPARKVG